MSLEDFQLLENETIDNSIIKKDFLKIYHQPAANSNDSDQNIEFILGANNNYQIDNAYLQNEMTIEKDVAVVANRAFATVVAIRLVNIAFAYCFKEDRLSMIGSSDIEHNIYCGKI